MGERRLFEFVKTAGVLGGGSVVFAVICFFITLLEHIRDHNVSASVFGFLTVSFFCLGAFQAWNKERDARVGIERKSFDERPRLGLNVSGVEGPEKWRASANPVDFSLQHLSGRIPTSIRFDPIPSKLGEFSLCFDSLAHVEQLAPKAIRYIVLEPGKLRLNAYDLEKIGNIEGLMLKRFLDDSPSELIELRYILTMRFKDGEDERTQLFQLTFEKDRFRFLSNTAI